MPLMFLLVFLLCYTSLESTPLTQKTFTIMLDPTGDAHHTGKVIENTFERSITLAIAQELEKTLPFYLNCRVIITRSPGNRLPALERANFSNRLPIDLFINITCYHAPDNVLSLYLYHFSYGEQKTVSATPRFIPIDKAHQRSAETTKNYANQIVHSLAKPPHSISTHGPFCMPYVPLRGISAPALCIEFFLTHSREWESCIDPLASSIAKVLDP